MQITEIKNNLVRISYEAGRVNLILSGFVLIRDQNLSYIAQVVHLEANSQGSFAVLKLLFTFDNSGVLNPYNGSIPSPQSELEIINTQELLNLFEVLSPVLLGDLAQQGIELNLDRTLFEENLLVCCEKKEHSEIFIKNTATQLVYQGKKVLIIDLTGEISQHKITAGEDFKLPLNYDSINFIYEKGLDEASGESKAIIQEVFLEVQNYVKTLPDKFLPFELFKNVVDDQYKQNGLVQLVLLKNKLLKFQEAGIFAQNKNEFALLEDSLDKNALSVLDVSKLDAIFQREIVSYAYSLISQSGREVYIILNINDDNSDKKLLKQIFTSKSAYSTLICPYSYKYLNELKQIAKNLIMFQPLQQQQDFAGYSTFLNKLNSDEFIIYGKTTHNIPLIVKLSDKPQTTQAPQANQIQPETKEEITYEEVTPEEVFPNESFVQESFPEDIEEEIESEIIPSEGELTEADLDFIEALNSGETIDDDVFLQTEETPTQNQIEEDFFEIPEPQDDLDSEILPFDAASNSIPVYSADVPAREGLELSEYKQGDAVEHVKYGKGIIEKMITYGSKTLCSIQFDNVGRRLLDPALAELKKI